MILCVLFATRAGNVLLERFHGFPAEERLHWRSFLVKLGAENLRNAVREELFVASHKSVYIVCTVIGEICIYSIGKDAYDELALSEVLNTVASVVKDVCGKVAPSERAFLEKYGKLCLCLLLTDYWKTPIGIVSEDWPASSCYLIHDVDRERC